MNILKQSTATTIKLGPFIDDTDGKTAETALTIAQADVRLSKNGGDFAQTNNTAGATHDENGYYDIPLNATDTGTLGRLRVAVSKSGALPVWQDFLVVTANVYDTLCSTDSLDVNVTSLADDVITAAKFDEFTAFPLKAADTGSTQVARTGADGDTLETLSDEIAAVQADLDNPDQYKADVSGIPAAVWGYATRTLSSFGTLISDIWAHATRTLSAFGFTVATQSDANVTAIKAKTDNLPAIPAPAGEYDAELAALQSSVNAIAPLDEVLIDTGTQQFTTADLIKIVAARMVGKASGGGTGTITYRNLEDTLDIVIMTVDEFGNRSEVELG